MKEKAQHASGRIAGEVVSFEKLFKANFKALHRYACTFVKDSQQAEDIVQQVFVTLWERSDRIHVQRSARAYLFRAVYHESLNHLKHMHVRAGHERHVNQSQPSTRIPVLEHIEEKELRQRLSDALNRLPEGCRTIFQLSRFESLKYREIAEHLDISVKTVENQMGKALRILRNHLGDYLPFLFYIILEITKS